MLSTLQGLAENSLHVFAAVLGSGLVVSLSSRDGRCHRYSASDGSEELDIESKNR